MEENESTEAVEVVKSEIKTSTLNVRKLIQIIKSHPLIYQTNHDSYRNSIGRNTIWEEIAMQMECPEKICKAKWRACRDQYARELKRYGDNMKLSRWKYARDLEFLRPYTLKRAYKQRTNFDDTRDLDNTDDETIKGGDISSLDSSGFGRTSEVSGEMQFEKDLINEIRQHEYIYNTHHPDYRKFENKKLIWESIGTNINKTEQQCRLKWKALRDQFSREAKRVSNCEDPENTPKWKHYDDLKFLEKYVKLSDTKKGTMTLKKMNLQEQHVIIRKTKRKKIKKNTDLMIETPIDNEIYDEEVTEESVVPTIVAQGGAYTFEIVKTKEESTDTVTDEIFVDDIDYDISEYENEEEDIISKEHSYPTNEIIEFISFSEAINEVPEEEYQLNEDKLSENVNKIEEVTYSEVPPTDEKPLNKSITEDTEVDAFFKTLAMKVKNAKLSQTHFTDLQIELLQTIQNKLKNS